MTRLLTLSLVTSIALAGTGEAQQKEIKRDRNLISLEELSALQGHNGYEVVEKLRPDWLRRSERRVTLDTRRVDRGRASGNATGSNPAGEDAGGSPLDEMTAPPLKLTVFVDQTEMGGVDELQRLRNDEIQEIRFLNGSDAQQRYGPRFAAGVIQVKLKNS
jgi:hypothetical protein